MLATPKVVKRKIYRFTIDKIDHVCAVIIAEWLAGGDLPKGGSGDYPAE